MTTNLTIRLKRASKIYHEGDIIAGVVVVESAADLRHEGLTLAMDGAVTLTLSAKHVGIFDAFSNNIRPIPLVRASIELAASGRVPAGVTEIPFELPLRALPGLASGPGPLPETYHGVFVNVTYVLRAAARRSLFNKPLAASCQLFVQAKPQEALPLKPVRCLITPGTIRAGGTGGAGGSGAAAVMPQFKIHAELDSTVCALDKPITGLIRVDECSVAIKSLELQLVRVETCGGADGYSRDATEIQNIQVGAGDVRRGRCVPLYMLLPRLFTCPTISAPNYKIEFELNIAVIFEDDYLVTENFPILLVRIK